MLQHNFYEKSTLLLIINIFTIKFNKKINDLIRLTCLISKIKRVDNKKYEISNFYLFYILIKIRIFLQIICLIVNYLNELR